MALVRDRSFTKIFATQDGSYQWVKARTHGHVRMLHSGCEHPSPIGWNKDDLEDLEFPPGLDEALNYYWPATTEVDHV